LAPYPSEAWTDQATLDLGTVRAGRPDFVATSNFASAFTLNLSNLSPWSASDLYYENTQLDWFVPNLGVVDSLNRSFLNPNPPQAGDTTLVNETLPSWPSGSTLSNGNRLIQGSLGDKLYLIQTQANEDPVMAFRIADRMLAVPAFDQVDGLNANLSGALQPVSTTPLDVHIDLDSFGSQKSSIFPTANLQIPIFEVFAQPGDLSSGICFDSRFGVFDPIRIFWGEGRLKTGTLDKSFAMGDPFPGWAKVYRLRISVAAIVGTAPGGNEPLTWVSDMEFLDTVAPSASKPWLLPLGPPQQLQINGLDMQTSQLGVGETPLISWTAPSLGVADRYLVQFWEVTSGRTFSGSYRGHTALTSFQVPPGFLQKGKCYVATVSAESGVSVTQPSILKASYARVPVLSGCIFP
jgi:hypothetical protein